VGAARVEPPHVASPPDEIAAVHERSAGAAYAHIFSTPFPRDEARRRWAEYRGQVWVARTDSGLVGFAAATGRELDALYVLPEAAGAGVGSALLDALGPVLRLWVLADNHHARGWYERRRWRATGERRPAYDVVELLYVR
jgi:GNAT superfamily N-acetyltransferase